MPFLDGGWKQKAPRRHTTGGAVARLPPGGGAELFDVQAVIPRSGSLQQGGVTSELVGMPWRSG